MDASYEKSLKVFVAWPEGSIEKTLIIPLSCFISEFKLGSDETKPENHRILKHSSNILTIQELQVESWNIRRTF